MPGITLQSRVRRADDAAWRLIDGQAVIVSSSSQRMRVLNEVGSRIWDMAQGQSLGAIAEAVGAEFEADSARIEADVLAFAEDLVGRGMLVLEDK